MKEQEKSHIQQRYEEKKKKGVLFFPDLLFKDAIVALLVFAALVALAFFLGAPLEERADPGDTTYTPRPEWYFLFIFQLLKYFPGSLEVLGVIVLPTLAILGLFLLPFLDRRVERHPSGRKWVVGLTGAVMIAITALTVQAYREAPPPAEVRGGDPTAALYTENCAGCHGPSITVQPGTNLHDLIAEGSHEGGMPAWSGDLTSDQIDALVGFILSPAGNQLFVENCSECHQVPELVAGDPLALKAALENGATFKPHLAVDVPDWTEVLSPEERTGLLNFLAAPDGQRLFTINCAACHGREVGFAGDEADLRALISEGGLHLEMPPWRERLLDAQLDTLAAYVVNPASTPDGEALFGQFCAVCHGERIPSASDLETARQTIASGGPHETMPVWGQVLTSEQLDALVSYTFETAQGAPLAIGQELYATNCAACHGDFGEGGPNPARPDDIIAPISSAEYLRTRDDTTLRSIISQGQPNFGMSPFGSAFGGPLEEDEVDAIVAFLRSWEADPPVELPPEISATTVPFRGVDIYAALCAQCHGELGEGLIGPSLRDPDFQSTNTDDDIFNTINQGHAVTSMIAWGEILTSDQIQQLVETIRAFPGESMQPSGGPPSFAADVLPIFEAQCTVCHGNLGGWDGTSYQATMTTGNNAPVVIPGDVEGSLLAQKVLGTHTQGAIMPPAGRMADDLIQVILDWISDGAQDN